VGLKGLDLGYAARFLVRAPIHGAMASCRTGERLTARRRGQRLLLVRDGVETAPLSRQACERWLLHLDQISALRVMALKGPTHLDGAEVYRSHY
jgi:hypothetical protein